MIDGVLGIDVSKNALDVSLSGGCNKVRARSFVNSADGWRHLLDWLITQKIQRVHACLESTGRYGLGIACALHEAGHVVSIVNPAQIKDFARTKLDFGQFWLSSPGPRDPEDRIVFHDLVSAFQHQLHASHVAEARPATFDVRPIEQLEAISVRNGTQPCDWVRGAAVDDQVGAATWLDVEFGELGDDLGQCRIGLRHIVSLPDGERGDEVAIDD